MEITDVHLLVAISTEGGSTPLQSFTLPSITPSSWSSSSPLRDLSYFSVTCMGIAEGRMCLCMGTLIARLLRPIVFSPTLCPRYQGTSFPMTTLGLRFRGTRSRPHASPYGRSWRTLISSRWRPPFVDPREHLPPCKNKRAVWLSPKLTT